MNYNKIRINFTGYNRTLSQYEEAKAEAEKTYTPEAFYKWNKEAVQMLREKTAGFKKSLNESNRFKGRSNTGIYCPVRRKEKHGI